MLAESTLSFTDSLIISLFGFLIVFLVLISLCIAILIISRILKFSQNHKGKAIGNTGLLEEDIESMAIMLAAISEDTGLSPDQFRITRITER